MPEFQPKDWSKQGYGQLATNIWENPDGFHFSEVDGMLRKTDSLSAAQAQRYGVTPEQLNASTAHNKAIQEEIAKKKQAGQQQLQEPAAQQQQPAQPPVQRPPTEIVHAPQVTREEGYTRFRETTYEAPGASIVPVAMTADIVRPVVSVQQAVDAWNTFTQIKQKLMTDDDYNVIGGKKVPAKSFFRKVKTVFNISLQLLREVREDLAGGEFQFTAYVRAQAPNGVYVDAVSSCASSEPFGERQKASTRKLIKDPNKAVKPEMYVFAIRGMAQTRAYNRAISDLVGGGDVSAEETAED